MLRWGWRLKVWCPLKVFKFIAGDESVYFFHVISFLSCVTTTNLLFKYYHKSLGILDQWLYFLQVVIETGCDTTGVINTLKIEFLICSNSVPISLLLAKTAVYKLCFIKNEKRGLGRMMMMMIIIIIMTEIFLGSRLKFVATSNPTPFY